MPSAAIRAAGTHGVRPDAKQRLQLALDADIDVPSRRRTMKNQSFHGDCSEGGANKAFV
jgi:hypothetical protein